MRQTYDYQFLHKLIYCWICCLKNVICPDLVRTRKYNFLVNRIDEPVRIAVWKAAVTGAAEVSNKVGLGWMLQLWDTKIVWSFADQVASKKQLKSNGRFVVTCFAGTNYKYYETLLKFIQNVNNKN